MTYAFHADLAQRVGSANTQVSAGVGTAQAGMKGVRRSYQEARHALFISRRLRRDHGLTFFHELGVHRLLFAARDLGEMRTFHDEALSRLIEYDREHGSDLIETLRAYFDGRCGPKEAASILGVHRNTVLYRIERIEELTGLDLDNPEVRLRLHLALYAHDALFAEQSAISTS